MEIARRTAAIKPVLEVTPPSRRPLHNSMRCAPPCSAAIADSTESTHTSRMTSLLIIVPITAVCGLRADRLNSGDLHSLYKQYTKLNCPYRASAGMGLRTPCCIQYRLLEAHRLFWCSEGVLQRHL